MYLLSFHFLNILCSLFQHFFSFFPALQLSTALFLFYSCSLNFGGFLSFWSFTQFSYPLHVLLRPPRFPWLISSVVLENPLKHKRALIYPHLSHMQVLPLIPSTDLVHPQKKESSQKSRTCFKRKKDISCSHQSPLSVTHSTIFLTKIFLYYIIISSFCLHFQNHSHNQSYVTSTFSQSNENDSIVQTNLHLISGSLALFFSARLHHSLIY